MIFLHISDLHIGKRLNEYSLIEEQRDILDKIARIANDEKPDGVLIAGDVYDKSVPGGEAVALLDEFLEKLEKSGSKIFMISGNHDCAERVAYGKKAFERAGIFISPVFDGAMEKIEMFDEYGKVNVYLLPFVKPSNVRRFFDEEIETYTDAVDCVLRNAKIDETERNVILSHQFVTGAERRDSEQVVVGGIDNVEGWVFDKFDYVALGHIHKNQSVGRKTLCYSGTPLKYSASEAKDEKCVVKIELKEKGCVNIEKIPLVPLRDFVDIKGNSEEILKNENKTDFVRVTLTDEDIVVDAYGKLKTKYPFMTEILFEKKKTFAASKFDYREEKSEKEQFEDFFSDMNSKKMTDEQYEIIESLIEQIKEGEA